VRVLVCPDKYAGTLSADAAARAIAAGWADAAPEDQVEVQPLSDGGPGFVDVIAAAVGGRRLDVPTRDPLGRPVTGTVLVTGPTAYVESAHACGLHLLTEAERDPVRTTSYGLGALVATAVEAGAGRVVVGLGGSATNDGGAGLLAALGAAPLDVAGYALPYGGGALVGCHSLGGTPRLRGVELVAATDVDSPLTGPDGASARYGPQKGAGPAQVQLLDAALARFAGVLERCLPGCPPRLAALPGAGAAGGLGAALLACGGRRVSGIDLVLATVGLDARLDGCDVVVTGEGRLDAQSARGKVVAGVAAAARRRGLPCLVLAGEVMPGYAADVAGVTQAYSLVDELDSPQLALTHPAAGLRTLARDAARSHHRPP
jgi:glycerate kinase